VLVVAHQPETFARVTVGSGVWGVALSRFWPGGRPVAAEVAAAVLLVLPGAFATAGFVLVILRCAVFAVAIESSVRRNIRVLCPCFGASADLLDRRHLVREAILVAVSVAGRAGAGTGRPAGLVDVLVGAAAAVFVAAVVIRFGYVVEVLVPRPATRR
jgi:methylamine utilization protein MauE